MSLIYSTKLFTYLYITTSLCAITQQSEAGMHWMSATCFSPFGIRTRTLLYTWTIMYASDVHWGSLVAYLSSISF